MTFNSTMFSNLKWQKTSKEEEDHSSEHDHYLSSSPGHGCGLGLCVCLGVAGGSHGAPRVSRHLDIGREVTGDDGVQSHQHEQRQCRSAATC